MKLLGTHLTPDLSWDVHIQKTLVKANRARSYLFRLRDLLPASELVRFYKAAVRPLVEYCSPLLVGAPARCLHLVDRFEDRCKSIIRGSVTFAADLFANMDSVDLRRKVSALTY